MTRPPSSVSLSVSIAVTACAPSCTHHSHGQCRNQGHDGRRCIHCSVAHRAYTHTHTHTHTHMHACMNEAARGKVEYVLELVHWSFMAGAAVLTATVKGSRWVSNHKPSTTGQVECTTRGDRAKAKANLKLHDPASFGAPVWVIHHVRVSHCTQQHTTNTSSNAWSAPPPRARTAGWLFGWTVYTHTSNTPGGWLFCCIVHIHTHTTTNAYGH